MVMSTLAFAHSGRTDSNGGHWDHSTGTYHYHDGTSTSGSSSNSSSNSSSVATNEPASKTHLLDTIYPLLILIFYSCLFLADTSKRTTKKFKKRKK